ncbi:hypothetical protein JCM11641_000704 [Rhodosporidiobolus odoratus]
MQYDRPPIESAAFADGAASQPSHASSAHPSAQPHFQPQPAAAGAHAHTHPYFHHPSPPYPRSSYSFLSSFSWPRFSPSNPYAHPGMTFAPPLAGGIPPPPPPGFPPHPSPADFHNYPADRRAWRRFYRQGRRGPRILPFLLLGGVGIWGYKHLSHEIRDVKAVIAASDPDTKLMLEEKQRHRCTRWGKREAEDQRVSWREHENRWKEWQVQMQRQQQDKSQSEGNSQAQAHIPVEKLV